MLLHIHEATVKFGGVTALDGVSLDVRHGDVCALIGPNGAGKTTLFNAVTRLVGLHGGRIGFDGEDLGLRAPHEVVTLGIARTFQNLALAPEQTVLDNVLLGAHHRLNGGFVAAALRAPKARRAERAVRTDVLGVLDRLALADVANRPAADLPFGTLKRVELARALLARPRLLLLDEPASGLTHGEVAELGELICQLRDDFDLTVFLVEHHMGMVMKISDQVAVLDLGRLIATGSPATVQDDARVVEAYLGTPA